MEKENTYMQRMIDWKRVWLLFRNKIWILVVATLVGALLGALGYKLVDAITDEGQYYRQEGMTVGELKSKDFNADINALTVADLGITLEGVAGKVITSTDTVGALSGASGYTAINFSDRINALSLADMGIALDGLASKIIDVNTDTVGALSGATGYTAINFNDRINGLKLGADGLGLSFSGLMAEVLLPTDTIGGLTDGSVDINTRINDLTLEKIGLNLTGLAGKILKPEYTIGDLTDGSVDINAEVNELTVVDLGLDLASGKMEYEDLLEWIYVHKVEH